MPKALPKKTGQQRKPAEKTIPEDSQAVDGISTAAPEPTTLASQDDAGTAEKPDWTKYYEGAPLEMLPLKPGQRFDAPWLRRTDGVTNARSSERTLAPEELALERIARELRDLRTAPGWPRASTDLTPLDAKALLARPGSVDPRNVREPEAERRHSNEAVDVAVVKRPRGRPSQVPPERKLEALRAMKDGAKGKRLAQIWHGIPNPTRTQQSDIHSQLRNFEKSLLKN